MDQYKVILHFSDGSQIQSKVAATDQSDAVKRLSAIGQVVDFVAEHGEIESLDISYLGEYNDVDDDAGRFVLTPSTEREGWLVAVDTRTNMVMIFAEGAFEETVEIKPIDDMSPLDTATAIRELGDWLRRFHSESV